MEYTATAIYLRTSTDKQATGLESQKRALLDYCKRNNIENYTIYSDVGVSGKKQSRPSLNKLMDDCESGLVTEVITYSFSRFSRSTRHLLEALEKFSKLSINFVSISENLDLKTSMGRAVFTIISAIAQLEREIISERVRCGVENARAKGKQIGRIRTSNPSLIIELSKKGYSQREIARLADCSKTTVYRVLKAAP